MSRFQLQSRHTGITLVWLFLLIILWEFVPLPKAWKLLPELEETFLARGWDFSDARSPLEFTSIAPPPLPTADDRTEAEELPFLMPQPRKLDSLSAASQSIRPEVQASRQATVVDCEDGLKWSSKHTKAEPGRLEACRQKGGEQRKARGQIKTSTLRHGEASRKQMADELRRRAKGTKGKSAKARGNTEESLERAYYQARRAMTSINPPSPSARASYPSSPAGGPQAKKREGASQFAAMQTSQLETRLKPGQGTARGLLAPRPSPLPIEQACIQVGPLGCERSALEPFFQAIHAMNAGKAGAKVRITHFGDSIIASDYISATVRRRLQNLWGDAGHGFVLAARPWRWYSHRGVSLESSGDWTAHSVLSSKTGDRLFGLGGVSFLASRVDASTSFGTAKSGSMGRSVSRFDIYYQSRPKGGSLEVLINGVLKERLRTRSESISSSFHRVDVPDGPATLTLRPTGDGPVRLFGVTLERRRSGVIYDSIGAVGGSMRALRKIDTAHWLEQLRHRRPNLVVFTFGANESFTYDDAGPSAMRRYEKGMARTIGILRRALPDTAILVTGPLDSAERKNGEMVTRPSIPKLIMAQRRAALQSGAAFWNTFTVMGGEGSMGRWVKRRIGASDLVHPSWKAAVFLGNELARSLVQGYQEYELGQIRITKVAEKDSYPPAGGRMAKLRTPEGEEH